MLRFLQGGRYKICYSDDGTFSSSHVDVLDISMLVLGVFDYDELHLNLPISPCISLELFNEAPCPNSNSIPDPAQALPQGAVPRPPRPLDR